MDDSTSSTRTPDTANRSAGRRATGGPAHGLDLRGAASVTHDPSPAVLVERALAMGEGVLTDGGALRVDTGRFTGRSPKDRFLVENDVTRDSVAWGGINQPMSDEHFLRLRDDMQAHLAGRHLFVQDLRAGCDPRYRVNVRVVTEYAWHSLFAHNMFIRPDSPGGEPDWLVLDLPSFRADPSVHGCRSSTVIALDADRKLLLIGDTEYAGEIKKSIFSSLNLALPAVGVFPMHCSASLGADGATSLFFGLSGTGKTTLSADPERVLIGDDEHGWSDTGVFNFEGGCYAKVVNLSPDHEPEIDAASRRFGAILENVLVDPITRRPDFTNVDKTENTRSAYPLEFIPNTAPDGMGGHPSDIVLLTADAFGVMPPIARLSVEQAMYYFLSGYTAKLAGTERGVTEPEATFSTCFGAPFMPLPAVRYADMLGERMRRHGSRAWLVNTGWTGGAFGVGKRIDLAVTRRLVGAAVARELDDLETHDDGIFGLEVPTAVPGVPTELLTPRRTWADSAAFDLQARELASMFRRNFEQFEGDVRPSVAAAGPRGS